MQTSKALPPIGMLRWAIAVLLFAVSNSHLLAQQRDPGLGSPGVSTQRAALAGGASASRTASTQSQTGRKTDLQRRAPGTVFRDCAGCPEMVVIPPGSVTVMRENSGSGLEVPPRTVAIRRAIGMGKYEVTRAQFARFVQESGYATGGTCFVWSGVRYEKDPAKNWRDPGFAQTDNDPVVCVNWNDAKAYTEWLSRKSGKPYRLPSEAEWEYAARAGSTALRPWDDDAREACSYANVADLSTMRDVPGTVNWLFHECEDKHPYTAPVGTYRPNAFGLYDTLGNAWEWTEDCQDEDQAGMPSGDRKCGKGACCRRVLRGGGWVDSPTYVRYDFRFFISSGDRDFYIGFRVARTNY